MGSDSVASNRLVSVLVPVYNSASWLARCLDSILAQSYANLELLIYDDGSNDASEAIYSRYLAKDSRVSVVGKARVGIAEARNKLVEAATGYASIFIDSDDWVEPDIIEVLLSCLLSDNLDFCGCSVNYYQGVRTRLLCAGPHKHKGYEVYDREHVIKQYLELQPLHGSLCNKLIRTELLKQFSFNKGWSYAEDSSFVWKIVNQIDKVGLTNQLLYNYEAHAGGLSEWRYDERQLVFVQSWDQILNDVDVVYPQFREIARSSFLHINLSMLFSALKFDLENREKAAPFIQRIRTLSLPYRYVLKLDIRFQLLYHLIRHSWLLTKYSFKAARYLRIC